MRYRVPTVLTLLLAGCGTHGGASERASTASSETHGTSSASTQGGTTSNAASSTASRGATSASTWDAAASDGAGGESAPPFVWDSGSWDAGVNTSAVLFGGQDPTGFLADTWTWDGATWTQQPVTGPSARSSAAAATLNGAVVLFGGGALVSIDGGPPNVSAYFADTWVWNGASWSQPDVGGPSARDGAAAATLKGNVVLFGGGGQEDLFEDVWNWNGSTWTQAAVSGGPEARGDAMMATLGDTVFLYGGDTGSTYAGDVWNWDGSTWTEYPVLAAEMSLWPITRTGAAIATIGSSVLLFGGLQVDVGDGNPILGDTWTWDGAAWTLHDVPGPSPRTGAGAATVNGAVVLFGGQSGDADGSLLNDTWIWDGAQWTEQSVAGPPPRSFPAMAGL